LSFSSTSLKYPRVIESPISSTRGKSVALVFGTQTSSHSMFSRTMRGSSANPVASTPPMMPIATRKSFVFMMAPFSRVSRRPLDRGSPDAVATFVLDLPQPTFRNLKPGPDQVACLSRREVVKLLSLHERMRISCRRSMDKSWSSFFCIARISCRPTRSRLILWRGSPTSKDHENRLSRERRLRESAILSSHLR
jgi:hypothetical protein